MSHQAPPADASKVRAPRTAVPVTPQTRASSLTDLLGAVVRLLPLQMKDELELAKRHVAAKGKKAGIGAGIAVVGLFFLALMVVALVVTLIGAFADPTFWFPALMVALATALYSWLLSRPYGSVHLMLLVGVVLGGGLAALSTFMQRLLDPNSFDLLSARLFGNISNARTEYVAIAAPIAVVVCALLWLRSRRLNTVALGADAATNLGLHHRRELMVTLLLVSVLMAMTTALVGPMTFLGFLVATLAYSLVDTHDHRFILPVAALAGYAVLTSAYFVLRHVFYAGGAVTVVIELIGGITFLVVVMRKGRL